MATEQDLRDELNALKTLPNRTAEQEKYLELLEKHLKIIDRINKSLEEQQAIAEKILKTTNDESLKRQANLMLQENMERLHQRKIDRQKEVIKLQAISDVNDEKKLKKQIKLLKNLEDVSDVAQDMPDFIKGLFGGDPGGAITRTIGKVGGSIESQLTNNIKQAALGAETMGGAMKAAIGPAAMLAVFLFAAEIVKLAVRLHDAEGAFMQTTGASREFAHTLSDAYSETREFGASIEDTSKAMTSLFTNFTDFTMQNVKTRETLTETATVMSKLGVATDDFAKGIQNLTKAMGFNAQGAAQQLLNLEKFAEELGIAPSKMAADFAGAGGTLAKFGSQGVEAFKRLEIASKITGMEMQRILTLTEKFDTFEGAATMAGKLNAALGGNFVNAMDLMMDTDPVGRFEQIRDAILSTGMSFDDMTYFQKNMYKEMLGLQDVGELALLLSGRTDLMSQSFSQSAQSYEEAAERAKEIASFQEKLNILFADMIPILTPLIDVMSSVFEVLGFIAEGYSVAIDFVNQFEGALTSLVVVLSIVAAAAALYLAPFLLIPTAIAGVIAAIGALLNIIFHKRNSPTFFEGMTMLGEDILPSVEQGFTGTAGAIEQTSTQVSRSPLPSAAEGQYTFANNQSTQRVRQPISISLNGDKLKEFVIEVVGEKIKEVSVTQ
jgi:hypothetical protein